MIKLSVDVPFPYAFDRVIPAINAYNHFSSINPNDSLQSIYHRMLKHPTLWNPSMTNDMTIHLSEDNHSIKIAYGEGKYKTAVSITEKGN